MTSSAEQKAAVTSALEQNQDSIEALFQQEANGAKRRLTDLDQDIAETVSDPNTINSIINNFSMLNNNIAQISLIGGSYIYNKTGDPGNNSSQNIDVSYLAELLESDPPTVKASEITALYNNANDTSFDQKVINNAGKSDTQLTELELIAILVRWKRDFDSANTEKEDTIDGGGGISQESTSPEFNIPDGVSFDPIPAKTVGNNAEVVFNPTEKTHIKYFLDQDRWGELTPQAKTFLIQAALTHIFSTNSSPLTRWDKDDHEEYPLPSGVNSGFKFNPADASAEWTEKSKQAIRTFAVVIGKGDENINGLTPADFLSSLKGDAPEVDETSSNIAEYWEILDIFVKMKGLNSQTITEIQRLIDAPLDGGVGPVTRTKLVEFFRKSNPTEDEKTARTKIRELAVMPVAIITSNEVNLISDEQSLEDGTLKLEGGNYTFEKNGNTQNLTPISLDDNTKVLQIGGNFYKLTQPVQQGQLAETTNLKVNTSNSPEDAPVIKTGENYYYMKENGDSFTAIALTANSSDDTHTLSLDSNTTYNVTVSETGGNETLTFASQSEETTSALTQSHEQRILTDGPTITATRAPNSTEWTFTEGENTLSQGKLSENGPTIIKTSSGDFYQITGETSSNTFLGTTPTPLNTLTLDGNSDFTVLKIGEEYRKVSELSTTLTIEAALEKPTVKDATGTAITELTILKGSGGNPDYYEVSTTGNTLTQLTLTGVSPASTDATSSAVTLQNVLHQEGSEHVYVVDGGDLTQIALATSADGSARTFSHGDNTFSLTPGSSPDASSVADGNGEAESTTELYSQTISGKTITATPPSGGSTEWTYTVGDTRQTPVSLGDDKLLKIGNNYHKIVDLPNVENNALTQTTVITAAGSALPTNLVVLQDGENFYFRQGESGDFTQISSPEDIPGGVLSVTDSTVSFTPSPIESQTYNIAETETGRAETGINGIENGLFAKIKIAFSDQSFLNGLNESLTQVHSESELLLSLQFALLNWDDFNRMDNSDTKLTQAAETLFRLINKEALKKYREEKAGETPPSGSDLSQIFNRGYIIKVGTNFSITLNAGSRRLTVDPTAQATTDIGNAVGTASAADAGVSDSGTDHGREAPTTLEWTENGLSKKLLESLTDIQFSENASTLKQINTLQFIGQDHMANVDNLIKALHTSTEGVFDEEFKEFRTAYEKFVSQRSILRQNKFGRMSIMDIITSAGREHSTADDKSDWKKTTYRASLQGAMKRHGDREIITNPSQTNSEKHKKSDLSSELSDLYEYAEQALLKAKAMVDKIKENQNYSYLNTNPEKFSKFLSVAAEQFDADRPGWFKDWAED